MKFDDEYIFNSDKVANKLNNYYVDSVDELVANISLGNDYIVENRNLNSSLNSFHEVLCMILKK